MTSDDLKELLVQRDEVIAASEEFVDIHLLDQIDSEEIRELGRIVMETTHDECPVFSTT